MTSLLRVSLLKIKRSIGDLLKAFLIGNSTKNKNPVAAYCVLLLLLMLMSSTIYFQHRWLTSYTKIF
jgi:hypothetical protein